MTVSMFHTLTAYSTVWMRGAVAIIVVTTCTSRYMNTQLCHLCLIKPTFGQIFTVYTYLLLGYVTEVVSPQVVEMRFLDTGIHVELYITAVYALHCNALG